MGCMFFPMLTSEGTEGGLASVFDENLAPVGLMFAPAANRKDVHLVDVQQRRAYLPHAPPAPPRRQC